MDYSLKINSNTFAGYRRPKLLLPTSSFSVMTGNNISGRPPFSHDAEGCRVDREGKRVNKTGRLINTAGQLVDRLGRRVDRQGTLVATKKPIAKK